MASLLVVHDPSLDKRGEIVTVLQMETVTPSAGTSMPRSSVVNLARQRPGEVFGLIEETAKSFPLAKKYCQAMDGNMTINRDQLEKSVAASNEEIAQLRSKLKEKGQTSVDNGQEYFDSLLKGSKLISDMQSETAGLKAEIAVMKAGAAELQESNTNFNSKIRRIAKAFSAVAEEN